MSEVTSFLSMDKVLFQVSTTDNSVTFTKVNDMTDDDKILVFTRVGILPKIEAQIIDAALGVLRQLFGYEPLTQNDFIKYQMNTSKVINARKQ